MHVCYVGILYDAKVWGMNDSPAPRYNAIGGFSVLVPSRDEHTGASVSFFFWNDVSSFADIPSHGIAGFNGGSSLSSLKNLQTAFHYD